MASRSRMDHSLCDDCWWDTGAAAAPVRIVNPKKETCCLCGDKTESGIYARIDPSKTLCKGVHHDDETQKIETVQ